MFNVGRSLSNEVRSIRFIANPPIAGAGPGAYSEMTAVRNRVQSRAAIRPDPRRYIGGGMGVERIGQDPGLDPVQPGFRFRPILPGAQ